MSLLERIVFGELPKRPARKAKVKSQTEIIIEKLKSNAGQWAKVEYSKQANGTFSRFVRKYKETKALGVEIQVHKETVKGGYVTYARFFDATDTLQEVPSNNEDKASS